MQTPDHVIWHTRLAKNMLPTSKELAYSDDLVPDEWQPAMDFLRGLTKYKPDERLTASLAIQHPFIKLADRYRSDMSTPFNNPAKRARILTENAAPQPRPRCEAEPSFSAMPRPRGDDY